MIYVLQPGVILIPDVIVFNHNYIITLSNGKQEYAAMACEKIVAEPKVSCNNLTKA